VHRADLLNQHIVMLRGHVPTPSHIFDNRTQQVARVQAKNESLTPVQPTSSNANDVEILPVTQLQQRFAFETARLLLSG
jgi:hypothetical protein